MEDRKTILLRAAYDLLKRADEGPYVKDPMEVEVMYDDANCDGYCLMEDIMHELELEEGMGPIPLKPEDDECEDQD